MSQRDNPITSGNGLVRAVPAAIKVLPNAAPTVTSAKVARRVRKAVVSSTARHQVALAAPGETRIRANGRMTSVEMPRIRRDDLSANEKLPASRSEVLISIPRRSQSGGIGAKEWVPARLKMETAPKVGLPMLWRRCFVWFTVIAEFALATLWGKICRRDSPQRRAVRLRRAIERQGGTLVKIGRHMAVRLDILPVQFCEQLATMRDRMPPFPIEDAVAIVERDTQTKLKEVFSTFDTVPVESTSVACVYQAILRRTGEKVVITVRRPGINIVFEADYKILVFLSRLAESLTLIPPGYGEGFYRELRKTLTDELDFRQNARIEELFGRRARKTKKRFFGSRKIHFDLSTEEVLVREFASGIWLWEVLAALEYHDEAGLAYMRQLNIDPRKLARRLLFMHHWAVYEHVTFHTDPHPANIVVRANNTLVFVDFGTNGHVTKERRELFSRFYTCLAQHDVWGMAQATIALLEPLPARDLNSLAKEIEAAYYERLLAVKSKYSHWHERTSVAMWLATFQISRAHRIHVPMDVLSYVRATWFYDTLAARLWPEIDYFKEFKRYGQDAQKRQRQRSMKSLRRRLRNGLLTNSDFATLEKAGATALDLLFRLQRLLAVPYDFAVITLTIEKWVVTLGTLLKFVLGVTILTGLSLALVAGFRAATGQSVVVDDSLQQVFANRLYQIAIAVLALLNVRLILFRLADKTRKE